MGCSGLGCLEQKTKATLNANSPPLCLEVLKMFLGDVKCGQTFLYFYNIMLPFIPMFRFMLEHHVILFPTLVVLLPFDYLFYRKTVGQKVKQMDLFAGA